MYWVFDEMSPSIGTNYQLISKYIPWKDHPLWLTCGLRYITIYIMYQRQTTCCLYVHQNGSYYRVAYLPVSLAVNFYCLTLTTLCYFIKICDVCIHWNNPIVISMLPNLLYWGWNNPIVISMLPNLLYWGLKQTPLWFPCYQICCIGVWNNPIVISMLPTLLYWWWNNPIVISMVPNLLYWGWNNPIVISMLPNLLYWGLNIVNPPPQLSDIIK